MNTALRETRRNAATARIGRAEDGDCYLCGQRLAGRVISRDHVEPRSRFPRWARGPTLPTHADCNAAKGSLTLSEFVDLCRAVAAHHPP